MLGKALAALPFLVVMVAVVVDLQHLTARTLPLLARLYTLPAALPVVAAAQEAFINRTGAAMGAAVNDTALQDAACWALGRVAVRAHNSDALRARARVAAAGGVQRVLEAMGNHSHVPAVQHAGAWASGMSSGMSGACVCIF